MNMVRNMLFEKEVPKEYWPEAVNWSIYILNRCPTIAVKDVTPEEAWSGIKPSVHFFRIFGCVAHVHVPDVQRKKLDNKSIKCVLLGISEESKAYRLYDPVSKRIIVSRDVVFSETEKWNWQKGSQGKDGEPLDCGDSDQDSEASPGQGEGDGGSNLQPMNLDDEAEDEETGESAEQNPATASQTPRRLASQTPGRIRKKTSLV